MSSDMAFTIGVTAGGLALFVWLAWPTSTHRCRYPRCPHKNEKED